MQKYVFNKRTSEYLLYLSCIQNHYGILIFFGIAGIANFLNIRECGQHIGKHTCIFFQVYQNSQISSYALIWNNPRRSVPQAILCYKLLVRYWRLIDCYFPIQHGWYILLTHVEYVLSGHSEATYSSYMNDYTILFHKAYIWHCLFDLPQIFQYHMAHIHIIYLVLWNFVLINLSESGSSDKVQCCNAGFVTI